MSYYHSVNQPYYSSRPSYPDTQDFVEFPHGSNEYSQYYRSSNKGRTTDIFISKTPVHHAPYITQKNEVYEGVDEFHRPGKVHKTLKNISQPQKFNESGIIRETRNYTLYENKNWTEMNKKPIVETKFEPYPEVKEEVKEEVHIVKTSQKKQYEQEPNYIRRRENLNRAKCNVDDVRNYMREKEDNAIYEGGYNDSAIKTNKKIIKTTEIRTSNVKNYNVNKFNRSVDMKGEEYITTTKKRGKKKSLGLDQEE